ncbi:MAG: CoA transferase [Sinobacteraceae bacterium]|nr:CoA transferase [Nevskiaceae bacterium]
MASSRDLPLAGYADEILTSLARATGSAAIAKLDGATLLYERAMLGGMRIPGRTSAGGGCRLFDAVGDTIALNLSRPTDRELLPALFETDNLDPNDEEAIAAHIARRDAAHLLARGRSIGLAIAAEHEALSCSASTGFGPAAVRAQATGADFDPATARALADAHCIATASTREPSAAVVEHAARRAPRVLDLSALWAGPLAAHLLWLAGADVIKVESRTRPDAMRTGDNPFYALLNQGKASVVLDFREADDRRALLSLIATSDIVIEAARPRALAQLGIDVAQIVRSAPGLVWVTITGHGDVGEAANWVGFGDDCAVAGGLSAALRAATGRTGFVGDAIADPLTGMSAALVAWDAWASQRGGRFVLAMSQIVARCLATLRERDAAALNATLTAWSAAVGEPFPTVQRRPIENS